VILELEVMCPNEAVADAIAEALLEARLVACANRAAVATSLYRWQGRVEREFEVPLHLKTRIDLAEAAEAAIRSGHPYEVPPILRREVAANADYEAWVVAETS